MLIVINYLLLTNPLNVFLVLESGLKRLYAILVNTSDLSDWIYIMDPTTDLFISKYSSSRFHFNIIIINYVSGKVDGKLRVKRPGEKYVENTHGTLLLIDVSFSHRLSIGLC